MLQRIEQHNARQPPEQKIRVSVEVEKPREELFQLFGYGDVVSIPCSFSLPHPANLVLKRSLSIPLFCLPCLERLVTHGLVVLAGSGQSKEADPQLWALVQAPAVAKESFSIPVGA